MKLEEHYFWELAEVYLINKLNLDISIKTEEDREELLNLAVQNNLKIHFLKRLENPRMIKAVGMVRSVWPSSLLDIGSGKGFLLWHLSEILPDLKAYALDQSEKRIERLNEIFEFAEMKKYQALCSAANEIPLDNESVDCVTLFEVLEHIEDPIAALKEAARVSNKSVLISVPGKPDDNPEHIHLFDEIKLEAMLKECDLWPEGSRQAITRDNAHLYVFALKNR